jgi:DNA-binding beta-propeller fold protein YncE
LKREGLIDLVLAGVALLCMLSSSSFRGAYGKSPSAGKSVWAEAPHWGEGGVPQFQFDPSFPKMPSKWKMGYGSYVTGDNEGNVWVLSRPRYVQHPRGKIPPDLTSTPVPPVMEFDSNGNYIRGWGGQSGPGYQWPSDEHGLTVDYKGFVWIVGDLDPDTPNPEHLSNDNQILKFTKDGKFVMAIGTSGQIGSNATEILNGATSLYVYPKTNELFVTDGYGNSRVMVYDADTGKFRRMWGAYGHKPLDMDQRPARSKPSLNPWLAVSEVLQQFGDPVHDVKVSNDGLVYIADRGNKRVQVFTMDGKFLTEQFINLDTSGGSAGGLAFSPDERFLYVGGAQGKDIWILNRRTLEVLGVTDAGSPKGTHHHMIGSDSKGNLYEVIVNGDNNPVGQTGESHPLIFKYAFKGYSLKTSCPPCESVRTDLQ